MKIKTGKVSALALVLGLVAMAPSSFAVLHGVQIPESDFPGVRKISIGKGGVCTGTFIGPRTMLTAAHCIDAAQIGDSLNLVVGDAGPVAFRVHPRYASHARDMQGYDVALIQFSADQFFPKVLMAAEDARAGSGVTLVGYGVVKGVAGIKRMGHNVIAERTMGQFLVTGDFVDEIHATGTAGDSGGPLLNDRGEIVGVTSRESSPGMVMAGSHVHMSSYIDINEPEIKQWISDTFPILQALKASRQADGRKGS